MQIIYIILMVATMVEWAFRRLWRLVAGRLSRRVAALLVPAFLATAHVSAQDAQIIYVSTLYTTHVVFETEIKYGDLSNTEDLTASVVERSKNLLSIIALRPFESTANVTVLESNGRIHTFLLMYEEHPQKLIIDTRVSSQQYSPSQGGGAAGGDHVNDLWRQNAPPLQDVLGYKRNLYHLSAKTGKVTFACENIFSYSDITYMILTLENRSGVSFEVSDATFRLVPRDKKKRKLVAGEPVIPQNKVGTLTARAGGFGKVAYALDKLSLSPEQTLIIDLFEHNGQRHLELTLNDKDVNLAAPPADVR